MMVLVSYDISTESAGGERRLRRVAKLCQDYGQRVQYSLFECIVTPAQWTKLASQLEKEISQEFDSLRYYFLGKNWERRVEHRGAKQPLDQGGTLIF